MSADEIVELYDIHQTAAKTRRSVSWLYHHAGVDIPVTQLEPRGRLFWTAAQINEINTRGAIEPKAPANRTRSAAPAKATKPKVTAGASTTRLPVARPNAKRKGRAA